MTELHNKFHVTVKENSEIYAGFFLAFVISLGHSVSVLAISPKIILIYELLDSLFACLQIKGSQLDAFCP